MKKILKYLIIFIICCYMINVIRNLIILNKLQGKIDKLDNINEFSYVVKENGKYSTRRVKKDNVIKFEKIGVETTYYDNNLKERIVIDSNGEKNIYNNNVETVMTLPKGFLGDTKGIYKRAFTEFISSTKIDGKKCYKIKENKNVVRYISADDGLILRSVEGNTTYDLTYNIKNVDVSEIMY
ncbi:MAG: hypothetical protein HFJ45_00790 [Clostridia bacterium]|nr:hypothetical protein [Clostridia bacterium]